jgi:apolipoprotein N-acyltransferase
LVITGIQLEGATEREVLAALDRALVDHPQTDLMVLPEYTLFSPPTTSLRQWCARHGRHLLVGGVEPSRDGRTYRNTAFVIDPSGEVVFSQGKAVPIQFFQDGLPARRQEVWESPWGKIGILICYDLSYARVVDVVVRRGAQMLIVPTMDAAGWGGRQHALHARIAPVRSAEYRLPIVRIASSGISQITDSGGQVRASAPFPGQGATLSAEVVPVAGGGRIPPDRFLAPACTVLSAGLVASLVAFRRRDVTGARAAQAATAAC